MRATQSEDLCTIFIWFFKNLNLIRNAIPQADKAKNAPFQEKTRFVKQM
jgi:hypothetical protein